MSKAFKVRFDNQKQRGIMAGDCNRGGEQEDSLAEIAGFSASSRRRLRGLGRVQDETKLLRPLLAWFGRNARDLPWRRARDPYAIWISEVMLQQTQVKTVLPYWERWMKALPDVRTLARARPQKLHKLWEGLGYYTRVRNLQRAARIILEKHGGKFPEGYEDVLALPGIGRYTAGAICSIAFNQPRPILDGNVIRVLTRLFCIKGNPRQGNTNAGLWDLAAALVLSAASLETHQAARSTQHGSRSTSPVSRFNQSLMELGALICTPKRPRCGRCPVAKFCLAFGKGCVEELPELPRRVRPTARRFVAFVAENQGRFLVRQRPDALVNAQLWEFPNLELCNGASHDQAARALFGPRKAIPKPFCTIEHSITRYRITLEVVLRSHPKRPTLGGDPGRWLTPGQLRRLPFTSAHRRILVKLTNRRERAENPKPETRNPKGGGRYQGDADFHRQYPGAGWCGADAATC